MTAISRLKVLITHGQLLIGAGLESTLLQHADFELVRNADSSPDDATPARTSCADVVLADYRTGVGLAVSRNAGGPAITPHIVIITEDDTEISVRRAIEAGVRGYLLLGSTPEAIVQAVRCVARGGTALDPVAATRMLDSLKGVPMTHRESQVLGHMMLGLSNKAIAHRLGMRPGTAKCHVKKILAKLDASSRTQAVAIAQRRGLVPPQSDGGSEAARSSTAPGPLRMARSFRRFRNGQSEGDRRTDRVTRPGP